MKKTTIIAIVCSLSIISFLGISILAVNRYEHSNKRFIEDSFVKDKQENTLEDASTCEEGVLKFDESLLELKEKFPDSFLIIVAHKGKGEKKKINQFRLQILKRLSDIRKSPYKTLFAEGSPTEGLGRIDLYVGGDLYRQIYYDKNTENFCDKP